MSDIRAALLGRLPSGDGNGLSACASDMAKDPSRIRVAIVLFDADRIVEKTDDGNHEVRARLRRIEVLHNAEDASAVQRVLMREFERRTGQTVLPLDLESDIREAFEGLDIGAAEREEREKAEGHVEHEGADLGWAETLAALKRGEGTTSCEQCGAEIHFDPAMEGWLDNNGFPAADGHKHAPVEPSGEAGEEG